MSKKKQTPSLSNFYTKYGELLEKFLDETDVDSFLP